MVTANHAPLISIIVPVYRVESYLGKCLDSIVNQTYTNLDIILVDDGSPDRCGAICDEYAEKDARIRVIHQENKGVGCARNAGLDATKGDYIGFVDPDDHIAPEMYERLMQTMLDEKADIVCCNFYIEVATGKTENGYCQDPAGLPTQEYKDRVRFCMSSSEVWRHLFRKSLFDHLRFEECCRFEDFIILPLLYDKAEKIAGVGQQLYYYNVYNVNSLMAITDRTRIFKFDELCVHIDRIRMVACDDERFYQHSLLPTVKWAFNLLRDNAINPLLTDRQVDFLASFLDEYSRFNKRKALWLCFKWSRFVFNWYCQYRFRKTQRKLLKKQ